MPNHKTLTLEGFRSYVTQALLTLALAHVPFLAVIAWQRQIDIASITVPAALLAALPTLMHLLRRGFVATEIAIAIALVGQVSLLVYCFAGHPWQPDMHMYYFAVLALLVGFCDWRPIAVGAGLTAMHHLVLNFVLPAAVFYDRNGLSRVLIHAVIVIIETISLSVVAIMLARMFATNEAHRRLAEQAAEAEKQRAQLATAQSEQVSERASDVMRTIARFRSEMEQAMAVLEGSSNHLRLSADVMTGSARQTKTSISDVRRSCEATTTSISAVAVSGTQLAAAIDEIGRNVSQSSQVATEASQRARDTTTAIESLAKESQSIGAVVDLINSIAAQTNLLALNATIEAARAGEMGRGFAVVASEVKQLAAQTTNATKEISTRITGMQEASDRSVQAIREIARTSEEAASIAMIIAASVHEQSLATGEIGHSVTLSSQGASDTLTIVGAFEEVANHTSEAADGLISAADELARQAQTIRVEVDRFCAIVEAA